MVKTKAFNKTVRRTIKNHVSLFASIMSIMILGIAFITGLSATGPNMEDSVDQYFKEANVPDLIVKAPMGITAMQLDALNNNSHVNQLEKFSSSDVIVNDMNTRVYFMPLKNREINKIELLSGGRFPENAEEVLIEKETQAIKKLAIGTTLNYNEKVVKVVGIVSNPLYFSKENEPFGLGSEHIECIIYFDSNFVSAPFTTDVYIKVNNVNKFSIFSSNYKEEIKSVLESMGSISEEANPLIFLTLDQNVSYTLYESNIQKLSVISLIFPIFFILIAALVVLTTMTRLIEKERLEIGCYKTLGYSNGRITWKYMKYALMCSVIGDVIGLVSGFRILPMIIYNVYENMFYLPPLSYGFYFWFGFMASLLMTMAIIFVTLYVTRKTLKEQSAYLLRPKTPKEGKRIFLEDIGFIWKKLKFKYKSSLRNIFRYVSHMIMTVTSIAGCTALIFAGLAINDCIKNNDTSQALNPAMFDRISQSIVFVVLILIISAAALSIIVIFNLTNINIEERKKEIATLKVLGYKNFEVSGYIYREIYINSILGIIIGLPIGYGLSYFILSFMSSGSFTIALNINWYTWLSAVAITFAFILIVNLMLYGKIRKIDMNASLKVID